MKEICRRHLSDETELHGRMQPAVRGVVRGKKILAWQELLQEAGHVDSYLVKDYVSGFRLTGDMPTTGVFAKKLDEEIEEGESVKWLWQQAPKVRQALEASVEREERHVDREIADALEEATAAEVSNQWASGPLSAAQVAERVGPRWIPSRRFGVKQSDKVRPVDDFSESSTAALR